MPTRRMPFSPTALRTRTSSSDLALEVVLAACSRILVVLRRWPDEASRKWSMRVEKSSRRTLQHIQPLHALMTYLIGEDTRHKTQTTTDNC